jgi:hypothetical protein
MAIPELIEDHVSALGHGKDHRIPPQSLDFGMPSQCPEPGVLRQVIPIDGRLLSQVRKDFMGCALLKESQVREVDVSPDCRHFLAHWLLSRLQKVGERERERVE